MRGEAFRQAGEMRRQVRQIGIDQADEREGGAADDAAGMVADATVGIMTVLQAAHIDDQLG